MQGATIMQNVIALPIQRAAPAARKSKPTTRTRTFRRHADRLRGKAPLLENEIKALCWALNGIKACNLDDTDRAELCELLESREERRITREHSDKGIAWLRKLCFKLNGEPRKTQPLGVAALDIVRNFSHFTWAGLYNIGNYRPHYVPIWRTYARDGSYFDYYVASGGPGGGVEVYVL
jgi:hypothetical protein